jgi:DNA polymerase-3 subunit alpha
MPFVHLHVHTQYSILDGAAPIAKLFAAAAADNQPALAITDHGNMYGVKEFLKVAKKFPSIKPIVGCEFYVSKEGRFLRRGKEDQSSYHLVLLAKNLQGYKNLIKLSSYAFIEGYYYKPRIDRDLLAKYGDNLICSSACLAGEVPRAIAAGRIDEAEETILWYKNLFGEDYYLELQRHETNVPGADTTVFPQQQKVNKVILELAAKHNVKYIATNDVHFVSADDREAHDRLICLTTNADYDDPERLRYSKQEYLKSSEEMSKIFEDHPEALLTTLEIAEKIDTYSIDSSPIMPYFPIPEGYEDSNEYLKDLTYKGAELRYEEISDEIRERIDFELSTIKWMGFPDYFLIVRDFIQAGRDMGVSVGPGRGSVAGSVVAYCLRITELDPLKYNLLFERFLNPDRISMPDIDIDFEDDGRAKVLRYVEEKYGKEKVSHVITFGTMAARSAIRDVGRIQKLPLSETDRLAKLIPVKLQEVEGKAPEVSIANCIKYVPEFKDAVENGSPLVKETIEFAQRLEGNVRNVGVHACAILIGREDLREYIPISTAKDKETGEEMWVSQFEGSYIEEVGLLKMDFLGLKTLSIIKDAVKNVKKSKNIDLDIDHIPLDDKTTFDLFSRGDTIGTFQFESDGMRKWLRELKPNRFEDLIAMNALYRPGPMEYIPDFIHRKFGLKQIEYDLPGMEEVLQDTYGITVYQEQVMLLSQKLAGFTKGQADSLRKAMGKKLRDKMDELKDKFLEGGQKNGHAAAILEKIWKDWEAFAEYAFNKSHSACYAWVGYQTAYLKAHYPAEFMAATLSRNLNDINEIAKLMDECKRMGMSVLGPDINESADTFTVNKKGDIRFGMAGVKGVGASAVEQIVKARESSEGGFVSVFDFAERVNLSVVNKRTIESLVYAGAFDSLDQLRREQFFVTNTKDETFLDQLLRYGNRYQADFMSEGNNLFGEAHSPKPVTPDIPPLPDADNLEFLKREKELIGMYISAHPLDQFKFEIKNFTTHTLTQASELTTLAPKDKSLHNREIVIAGLVGSAKTSYTRSTGRPFVNFMLEDFDGTLSFALYGKDYEAFMQYTQQGIPLLLKCIVSPRFPSSPRGEEMGERTQPIEYILKIKNVRHLANTREDFIRQITVNIDVAQLDAFLRRSLVKAIKENRGKTVMILNIVDMENKISAEFYSGKYNIALTDSLIDFLEGNLLRYSFTPSLSF